MSRLPRGGLTTAQGSQDVTLGYSGGQANLFGNIPGKSVGIDVTVNLRTKINSIVRVMDQDLFKHAGTVEGEISPRGSSTAARSSPALSATTTSRASV